MTPQIRIADIPRLFSEGIEDDVKPLTPRQRRAAILCESRGAQLSRIAGGVGEALSRLHIANLLPVLDIVLRDRLVRADGLPDPSRALADPNGFCGLADDLSPQTMLAAQGRGLYPLAPLGPVAWWAPARRCAADPAAMAGTLAGACEAEHSLTFDHDFEQILVECARSEAPTKRRGLSPRLMHAFAALYDAGAAHSFVLHGSDGKWLGGGFGVATGRYFVTQHCFAYTSGAAAAGLELLSRQLAAWDFAVHDICPGAIPEQLRAIEMTRPEHTSMIAGLLVGGRPGRWIAERRPAKGAAKAPALAA